MIDSISFVGVEVEFSNQFQVMEPYSEKTSILLRNIETKKQKQIFCGKRKTIIRNQEQK